MSTFHHDNHGFITYRHFVFGLVLLQSILLVPSSFVGAFSVSSPLTAVRNDVDSCSTTIMMGKKLLHRAPTCTPSRNLLSSRQNNSNNLTKQQKRNNNIQNTTTKLNMMSPAATTATWITTSILGGVTGTPLVSKATNSWYKLIPLPSYTPPNRLFAPVWTILYGTMGYAASRIAKLAREGGTTTGMTRADLALALALGHYVLNLSWAPLFFGMKRLRAAHVLNVVLVLSLVLVMSLFWTLDATAGVLLVPYLVWLGFATRLSSGICRLNPTGGKEGGYNNAMLQSDIWKLRRLAAERVEL